MKIIAEVGSNVKTIDDCIKSISLAKSCGAHAVKFQYFTDEEMFGFDCGNKPIIDVSWLPTLKEKADACGIEFMCTFFSPESLKQHADLIDTVKIASSDMMYTELLLVAKSLKKQILLSTGGHSLTDVRKIVGALGECDLILLYCESVYPARRTNLDKLSLLKSVHKRVGVSDHSIDVYGVPYSSKHYGALVLEKHVNFCGYDDTPDAPHSLTADEFKDMVDYINEGDKINAILRSPDENHMVLRHNRRLIAIEDINFGETFKYGVNYGCFRSLKDDDNGLSPYYYAKMNGRKSIRDIKKGDSIGYREFQL